MAGSKGAAEDVETDHVNGRDRLDRDRPAGAERLAHTGVILGERRGAFGRVGRARLQRGELGDRIEPSRRARGR